MSSGSRDGLSDKEIFLLSSLLQGNRVAGVRRSRPGEKRGWKQGYSPPLPLPPVPPPGSLRKLKREGLWEISSKKATKPRYEAPRTPLLSAMLNESLHTYKAKTVEIM